jgi:hypothetical protein
MLTANTASGSAVAEKSNKLTAAQQEHRMLFPIPRSIIQVTLDQITTSCGSKPVLQHYLVYTVFDPSIFGSLNVTDLACKILHLEPHPQTA